MRERREDIPQLASHFVKLACSRLHLPEAKISRREMDRLHDYDWPGNARELQNVVERALILAQGAPLQFDLHGARNHKGSPAAQDRAEFYTDAEWRERERENLHNALKRAGGKVSGAGGAAELLGVNANTLASRLRAFGISRNYTA